MPRYFFNLKNSIGDVKDHEGLVMSDLDAARAEAIKGARSVIASEVLEGRLDLAGHIDVTDEKGALVLTVTFQEAVSRIGVE
jgi:hypothetical protein